MLRVMIVEDEYLEMELLESQIPWGDLGFQVVATASDGNKGLEMAAIHRPDVVITDVKMPFMDGVAMAQALRENYPEMHIVFLSGYGQFDYLKAAMQVGADDYLLKPVELDEMLELLQRLYERCMAGQENARRRKSVLSASAAQWLTGQTEPTAEEIEWMLKSYFEQTDKKQRYFITSVTVDEFRYIIQNRDILDFTQEDVRGEIARLGEFLPCMLVELNHTSFAVISPAHPGEALEAWRRRRTEPQAFITALYHAFPLPSEGLKARLPELQRLRHNLVLLRGGGQMKEQQEAAKEEQALAYDACAEYDLPALHQSLMAGDADAAQRWLDDFFRRHTSHNIHMLTIELVDRLDRLLQAQRVPMGFSSRRKALLIKRLLDVESAVMLQQMMQTHLQELMALIEPAEHNYQDRIVRDTMLYIQSHFQQPFTVEELAAEMHYSPNHLRYVFKKVTGRTLSEEITLTRLEQAKRMLRETPLRVHQISSQVGYTNPSYFIAQFLKKYGMTPVQYRNRGCL